MSRIIVVTSLLAAILFSQLVHADDPLPAVLSKVCTPTEIVNIHILIAANF